MLTDEDRRYFGAAHGMRGRVCALHPIRPADFNYLCELALTGEIPWQWSGHPESTEGFAESLRSNVLCQYVVVDRRSGSSVGIVRATGANFFHEHAYLSVFMAPDRRRSPIAMEAGALLVGHLFSRYGFRKIYAETLSPMYESVSSGDGRLFDVEARFRDYAYFEGQYVDKLVLTIDRNRWFEVFGLRSFEV